MKLVHPGGIFFWRHSPPLRGGSLQASLALPTFGREPCPLTSVKPPEEYPAGVHSVAYRSSSLFVELIFMRNKVMTHVVAGYPTIDECERIVLAMAQSAVAFIEIQMPFSDPIADGPTIMYANEQALSHGMTTKKCFQLIGRLKKKITTPILVMTYYNIAFRYGLERFCKRAKSCGVYGLIIPDIPIDEEQYDHYLSCCKKYRLHPIQVISPITPERRLKQIARVASGFVYCVSTFGTTGARSTLNPDVRAYLKKVKKHIKIPLALGFGISNRGQVLAALKTADIAVVGSKLINIVGSTKGDKVSAVKNFLRNII
ncbi:tryptophan synthase subunit alpha [Candidatus Uhrbacteria bacterium]|nr:tryptophan synthase subunit alpha [Candidatus Uhrbacteria bacterium]